jgi:hypothetical protein
VIEERADTWEGSLEVKAGTFKSGEARAIAVAVVPINGLFAYETLTWCDHIELELGEPAATR